MKKIKNLLFVDLVKLVKDQDLVLIHKPPQSDNTAELLGWNQFNKKVFLNHIGKAICCDVLEIVTPDNLEILNYDITTVTFPFGLLTRRGKYTYLKKPSANAKITFLNRCIRKIKVFKKQKFVNIGCYNTNNKIKILTFNN